MSRYPQPARRARVKCIDCNAPVVETVAGEYVCVECGSRPVEPVERGPVTVEPSVGAPGDASAVGD